MIYRYRPPIIIQKLFHQFVWNTSNNKILLTFDDGPTDNITSKILTVLARSKIKAVFFCVGNNIMKYPELTAKILDKGHTIANHTMNHKPITGLDRESAINEIKKFNDLMKEKFNYDIKYFRPPHGRFNLTTNNLMNSLNLKCVMWNLLTYDFGNDYNKVQHSIDNYLGANSLIVFHDNVKCSSIIEDSLNYTIDKAAEKGFSFGEPADCLK